MTERLYLPFLAISPAHRRAHYKLLTCGFDLRIPCGSHYGSRCRIDNACPELVSLLHPVLGWLAWARPVCFDGSREEPAAIKRSLCSPSSPAWCSSTSPTRRSKASSMSCPSSCLPVLI